MKNRSGPKIDLRGIDPLTSAHEKIDHLKLPFSISFSESLLLN